MADRIEPKHRIGETDFSIQRMYRSGINAMPRPHTHESYEIYYLTQGERVYFMNGNVHTVSKGELMFINPGDLHSTASSLEMPEFERILIHFTRQFVAAGDQEIAALLPLDASRLIRLPVKEQPVIERLLTKMIDEAQSESPHYVSFVRALLIELLILLGRMIHTDHERIDLTNMYKHPMHQKISEIALYMNRSYEKPITLEQVSKQFYISPSHLSRVFKRLTGFQFREYLQVVRIREAQKLLETTSDPVQLIAEKVGFEHIAHFNKTFKKWTSVTPLGYRKSNKK